MTIPIRAVIFDFGGVLTCAPGADHWRDLMTAIAGRDGAADRGGAGRPRAEASNVGSDRRPRLEELRARYHEHRGGFDRGELSGLDYWAAVLGGLGVPGDGALLRRLFGLDTVAWTQSRTDVLEWATALRAAGRRTGILSNMPTEVLRMVEERMRWVGEFDPCIYSCRLGLIKPEPAIYRVLLDELPVPPPEVLFLDDREENVAGARDVGMQAERFQFLGDALPLLRQRYGLPGPEVGPGASPAAAAPGSPHGAASRSPGGEDA